MEKKMSKSFRMKFKRLLAISLAVVVTFTTVATDKLTVYAANDSMETVSMDTLSQDSLETPVTGTSFPSVNLLDSSLLSTTMASPNIAGPSLASAGVTNPNVIINLPVGSTVNLNAGQYGYWWLDSYAVDFTTDTSGYTEGSSVTVVGVREEYDVKVFFQSNNGANYFIYTINVVPAKVTSITINGADTILEKTTGVALTANVLPNSVNNKSVAWMSNNTSALTVDSNGVLTVGDVSVPTEVIITATATDGSNVIATKKITVMPAISATEIKINGMSNGTLTMTAEKSTKLSATVLPDTASNKVVKWSSSDDSVASVDSVTGNVTTKSVNATKTAVITATATDGSNVSGQITITVNPILITGITVNLSNSQVTEKQSITLTANVSPSNAGNKVVTWSSSRPEIASVDSNGVVSANSVTKDEKVIITATAQDGSGKTGSKEITVKNVNYVETITLSGKDSIKVDGNTTFTLAITPSGAANKEVTWSSADPTIASVNSNGKVTGKKIGQTTIFATARDGSGVVGSKTIVVTSKYVYDVTFDANGGTGADYTILSDDNASIILPSITTTGLSRSGYQFVGWSTDESGEGYNYIPGNQLQGITSDTTLYAIWFKTDLNQDVNATYYVRLDGKMPYEPSGYDSSSYSDGVDGKIKQGIAMNNDENMVKANLSKTPSDDQLVADLRNSGVTFNPATQEVVWYVIKLGGHWHVDGVIRDKSKVTVTYNANGGSVSVMPAQSEYAVGATVNVDFANNPSKSGYQFLGWSTDKNANAATYTSTGTKTFVMGSSNVTLYAIWQANGNTQYKVSVFLGNGDKTYSPSAANSYISNARTDSTVNAIAKDIPGYVFNSAATGSVLSVVVAGDGSSELKLYYDKKSEVTITANSQEFVYDGTKHSLGAGAYTVANLPSGYTVSGISVSTTGVTNVSEGSVATSITGTPVIKDASGKDVTSKFQITFIPGSISVTPAEITVVASNETKTYGEPDPSFAYKIADDKQVVSGNTLKVEYTRETGEDVKTGGYAITPKVTCTSNYTIFVTSGKLTINPLAVVVIPSPIEKVYKKADPSLTYTTSVEITKTMSPLDVTLKRADGEAIGTYPITVTPGSNPNYTITTGTANFTIKQGEATVTIDSTTKVYGEVDPTFKYTISGTDYTAAELQLTFSRAKGEDVTKTGHEITAVSGDPNIILKVIPGTLTITKRPVTVSVNSVSKVFGDTDPSYTYSVTEGSIAAIDLIGGITDTNKFKVTVDREAGSDVKAGGYALTPVMSGSSIANYDVKTVAGTLTINPMPVTISVNGASKVFGDKDTGVYTYVAKDNNNNTLTGVEIEVTRNAGEDAGTYAINASIANPNYAETVAPGVFTIQPKAITVSANSVSKTYGDADPTFTSRATDVNGNVVSVGSEVSISLTRENAVAKNVGTYAIKTEATCATNSKGNKNYTITPVNGTLTITPFEVTVTAGNGSKSFGEPDQALDYSLSKTLPYGDVLGVSVNRVTGEAVGDYATTATVATNNNYKVTTAPGLFTITKKDIQVVIENVTKVYGNSDPTYKYSISGTSLTAEAIGLTFERKSGEDVGDYEVTAKLDSTNANYNLVSVTPGKLTIEKRPITVTAVDTTKVYGETNPVFNYTISGNGVADRDKDLKGQFDVAISVPSVSDAGTYTISPSVIGSNAGNYAVTTNDGTYAITKKALTVTAKNIDATYGDTTYAFESEITGLVNGDGADVVTVSYNCAATSTSNVGTYDITPIATSKNYTITPVTGKLTIAPKAVIVTVDSKSKIYGEADPEFTAMTNVAGVTITFTREPGEDAGTYNITPVITDKNYVISGTPEGLFTINKRDITLTMGTFEKTYGSADPAFTYNLSESLISGNTLSVTVNDPAENVKYDVDGNVVPYVLVPNLGSDSSLNYNVKLVNGSLKINPFNVSVSADDKTVTYGDTEATLTSTMSPTTLPNNETLTVSLTRAEGKDAGIYVITPSVEKNGNYKVTTNSGSYKINPKAISVIATDADATYGDDSYTFGYTVSPELVGSDTIQVSYNTTASKNSNVGEYVITPVIKENMNYVFTPVAGTLTIGKKSIALTVDNTSKVYGDKDPQFTYTTSESIISGNTISVNMVRAAGEDVNADGYLITATVAETQNYAIETVPGVFTITQRPVKITVPSVSKTYGESDPVFKYSVSDLGSTKMEGLSVPVVLSRVSGENAGTYALLAKVNSNNFKATYELGNLEIGKKKVEVSVNDASKFVGEKDPVFTYSVDGLVGSDKLDISVVRYVGEAVGTYSIVAYVGSTNNYNVVTDYGTLTINALTTLADGTVPLSPSLIGEATQTTNRTPNNTTADQTDENVQIAEDEVPLADTPSVEGTDRQDDDGITVIDDEDTAKAAMLESDCWIHWLILLLTAVYSVFAIVRANQRNKKIREMEEEKETANV